MGHLISPDHMDDRQAVTSCAEPGGCMPVAGTQAPAAASPCPERW